MGTVILLDLFLLLIGLVRLCKPDWVWELTEQWKSRDAGEPSSLYIISTRIGGGVCILTAVAATIVYITS